MKVEPDNYKIIDYVKKVKDLNGRKTEIFCGYEAGCLEGTLYKQLSDNHIDCVIMATSTIITVQTNKKRHFKNDKRDAEAKLKADVSVLLLGEQDYSLNVNRIREHVTWLYFL